MRPRRITSLALAAVLLLCVARLLWRWQAAVRRRHALYAPAVRHSLTPPPVALVPAPAALEPVAQLPAVGRAAVTYTRRLTRRPDLAATVTAWWNADAAVAA